MDAYFAEKLQLFGSFFMEIIVPSAVMAVAIAHPVLWEKTKSRWQTLRRRQTIQARIAR